MRASSCGVVLLFVGRESDGCVSAGRGSDATREILRGLEDPGMGRGVSRVATMTKDEEGWLQTKERHAR